MSVKGIKEHWRNREKKRHEGYKLRPYISLSGNYCSWAVRGRGEKKHISKLNDLSRARSEKKTARQFLNNELMKEIKEEEL